MQSIKVSLSNQSAIQSRSGTDELIELCSEGSRLQPILEVTVKTYRSVQTRSSFPPDLVLLRIRRAVKACCSDGEGTILEATLEMSVW